MPKASEIRKASASMIVLALKELVIRCVDGTGARPNGDAADADDLAVFARNLRQTTSGHPVCRDLSLVSEICTFPAAMLSAHGRV
jgi:hypothetical protein